MARRRRTVRFLAGRAGIQPGTALNRLKDGGLALTRTTDVVAKSKFRQAEILLGLATNRPDPSPHRLDVAPQEPAERATEQPDAKLRKKKRAPHLKAIGREQPLSYVDFASAELIHWQLVRDFAATRDPVDPPGIKSENMLHSAISRPRTSLGGVLKYPTAPMAAAALLHSMVLNHPFHNGNKRTALVALIVFLDKNGWSLRAEEDELFEFVLSVASHRVAAAQPDRDDATADAEVIEIASWIHKHVSSKGIATRRLKFHDLRSILLKYDCTFRRTRTGNRIEIRRGDLSAKVWFGGDGREVESNTVNEIRSRLELDEDHGYDRDLFYNAEEKLPAFITKYRTILERLAKT